MNMIQYEPFEMSYEVETPIGCEYTDIAVTAEFRTDNNCISVNGFYDGDGIYKVRFLPLECGRYSYCIKGAVTDYGEIECIPSDSGKHGLTQPDSTHFRYSDGTPYYPFGTTVYALIHQTDELIEQTISSLASSPFNKVRFCVFPKDYAYNRNEPELYPFEQSDVGWNVKKPCFEFFKKMETVISRLYELDIVCDVILFHPYDRWGFSKLSLDESFTYIRYLVTRLSAYPNVWWSLANEYDLMHGYRSEDWVEFARAVNAYDPYSHPLSNHNCFNYWDFTLPEATHCSIQDINVGETSDLVRKYKKPVVFDECCYEGNIDMGWGNISSFEMVNRFWTVVVSGGYCTHGETYLSDDDVLWWSKGGRLKGESPKRIAFLRSIIEALPSPLEYYPEGVGLISEEMIMSYKKHGIPKDREYDFWIRGLTSLPDERIRPFIIRSRGIAGACSDNRVIIWYYGRSCPGFCILNLPLGKKYKVEKLDIWNMTRTLLIDSAEGNVRAELDGREGTAILATQI